MTESMIRLSVDLPLAESESRRMGVTSDMCRLVVGERIRSSLLAEFTADCGPHEGQLTVFAEGEQRQADEVARLLSRHSTIEVGDRSITTSARETLHLIFEAWNAEELFVVFGAWRDVRHLVERTDPLFRLKPSGYWHRYVPVVAEYGPVVSYAQNHGSIEAIGLESQILNAFNRAHLRRAKHAL